MAYEQSNRSLFERNIDIGPGTDNWDDFYAAVRNSPNTFELDINEEFGGLISTTGLTNFAQGKKNVLIQGLYGCTSVIAVSHRGKFYNQR